MKEKKYKIRPQVLIIAGVIVAVLIIAVIAGNIISARNKSKDRYSRDDSYTEELKTSGCSSE